MKRRILLLTVCFSLLTTITSFASLAPQCEATWNASSAGHTCGAICDGAGKPFNSTYSKADDSCTYDAGCCEGMPYQQCYSPAAVCDASVLTVPRGDSKFYNDHGAMKHGVGQH